MTKGKPKRIGADVVSEAFRTAANASREFAQMGVSAAGFGANFQRAAQLKMDEQEAAMRLATVCPPGLLQTLGGEVDRRTALFAAHPTMTARAAALRSVADDVITGRLS